MANSTAMMPAGRMISWSALASIRVVGSSMGWLAGIRSVAREHAPSRAVSGELPLGPVGMHRGLGPCRPAASVTRRSCGGSNSPPRRRICTARAADGAERRVGGRAAGAPLYCRTCEPTTRARVSLRDRRDARPDPPHLLRHPELRRPAVQGPAAVDGADAGARAVRAGRQADARASTRTSAATSWCSSRPRTGATTRRRSSSG